MEQLKCPNCGANIKSVEEYYFCPFCGTAIPKVENGVQLNSSRQNNKQENKMTTVVQNNYCSSVIEKFLDHRKEMKALREETNFAKMEQKKANLEAELELEAEQQKTYELEIAKEKQHTKKLIMVAIVSLILVSPLIVWLVLTVT